MVALPFALLLLGFAATNAAQALSPLAARFTTLLLMSAGMQCSQPALASSPKLLQALPPAALLPSAAASAPAAVPPPPKLPQLPPRSKASCPPLSRPRYLGPSAALWSLAPLHNCRSSAYAALLLLLTLPPKLLQLPPLPPVAACRHKAFCPPLAQAPSIA